MKTMREQIIESLRAGKAPVAIAEALGCSAPYVYAIRREFAVVDADTVAVDKRVAVKAPPKTDLEYVEPPPQDDDDGEVERLTSRVLDLNEVIVEITIENIRIKRALEDARAGG